MVRAPSAQYRRASGDRSFGAARAGEAAGGHDRRSLAKARRIRARAGRTLVVRIKPTAASIRRLRREKRLPGLLTVRATDPAGNYSTRTKLLVFR